MAKKKEQKKETFIAPRQASHINPLALGYAAAIISMFSMLVISILGAMGFYRGFVQLMHGCYLFYSLSVKGIICGMVEAGIICFVAAYLFGVLYNRLA